MKLEVGMYVRTNRGDITKISKIWENERVFFENKVDIDYFSSDSFGISYLNNCKANHNIIDLVQVGDYVNGMQVTRICFDEDGETILNLSNCILELMNEDIKSIVTKEQFESMSYKLED